MAKKKEEEQEQKKEQQQQQQNDLESIEKKLNDIMTMLNSIATDLKILEKVRDEVSNIYAKVDRLEGENEKMRKMLYWHRKTTEESQSHSKKSYYKKYYSKKGGNK